MDNTQQPPIVVIGAGIVGVCAASCLQRDGHRVMLIDPGEPGMGASFGNGACLFPSSILPVSMPGMLRCAKRWDGVGLVSPVVNDLVRFTADLEA